MTTKTWKPSDISNAKYIGPIEFQDSKGEWHNFEVLATKERIIFGTSCNTGFLESGYIVRDSIETLDTTLQEMLSDLETYYNDGPQYISRIICNECM